MNSMDMQFTEYYNTREELCRLVAHEYMLSFDD